MELFGFGLILPFVEVGGGFFAVRVLLEGVARDMSVVVEVVVL